MTSPGPRRREYVHQDLNREITAIGGYYLLVKEIRTPFQGRELLYLVGHAAFETTCCGAGGCAYALVPGFVLQWKHRTSRDGLPVSEIEPIHDEDTRERIRHLIQDSERVHQVLFQ